MTRTTLTRLNRFVTLLAAVGMLSLGLGLSGCQTVKGLGEDISNIGEAGEDAINDMD